MTMILPDHDTNSEIFQELNVRIKLYLILYHVDQLLDNKRKISKYTRAITLSCMCNLKQQQRNGVFRAACAEMLRAGQLEQ
ncbi:hypothetical protein B7P43_G15070 [Cryptotermes secundus]|uniref:Uncharacterized protein n=1 Tax=Cryptotermes secundus TaxID=105785 RepID=A0A2J7Q1K2_9NEOP|nr:hypothetical protein B7P43_G15070 [Cryptotermes secundus]